MKIRICFLALFLFLFNANIQAQPPIRIPADSAELSKLRGSFSFLVANDLGRNGYYDQKPIAEMMGEVAGITGAGFVAALGDVHHFMGVRSVSDPLWLTDYELVYSHPNLMIPWCPVLGNHEYKGKTQAVIDYSKISRRWQMPSRYYSKTFKVSDSANVLLLFIDTSPLIDKYRTDSETADASKQNMKEQLYWIDTTLNHSNAQWKIVMGHHPIFAATLKPETEQTDLQKRLKPILDKNKTDIYFCGHIHNFQHIRVPGSNIDYVVNTSGSLSRDVIKTGSTVFASSESGFIVFTVRDSSAIVTVVNKDGKIAHQFSRNK
jgi:hypothetical protein